MSKYFVAEILCLWLFRKHLEVHVVKFQDIPCGSTEIKGDTPKSVDFWRPQQQPSSSFPECATFLSMMCNTPITRAFLCEIPAPRKSQPWCHAWAYNSIECVHTNTAPPDLKAVSATPSIWMCHRGARSIFSFPANPWEIQSSGFIVPYIPTDREGREGKEGTACFRAFPCTVCSRSMWADSTQTEDSLSWHHHGFWAWQKAMKAPEKLDQVRPKVHLCQYPLPNNRWNQIHSESTQAVGITFPEYSFSF